MGTTTLLWPGICRLCLLLAWVRCIVVAEGSRVNDGSDRQ